ncbi:MAG: phage tail tape measure protein, partial [Cyanobacteria bacterium P01_D01_bin.56]
MTSLGTLTLDLKLNDTRYNRQIENARRLTEDFNREFSRRSLTLPEVNTRRFEADLRSAGSRGSNILVGVFQGVGQQIASTLTGAISAGLQGLTGTIGGVAKEFAGFDQQLNLLAVRTGASREELAEFEKVALRVGLTTSKLPAEAAAAGVELAQLGVQVPGLVENLDDVVGASEATGISITGLGRALQVGVNIFGETGETIESLSDKFVILANSTAVTSEADFLQFLSKAGASAQTVGVDLDELAAAFATVRDLGASPEVAATGINSLFTRLRGTTDEAKAALDELEETTGLQVNLFDELGNLRVDQSLFETLSNLRDALDQFSDEDRLDIIGQIFGSGSRGGANAINNLLKGLETNYQATFQRLTEITGEEAENASKVLISGFSGALAFIAGSVNTIQVELGRAFNSLLAPLAEGFGNLVTGFVLDQDPFAPIRDSAQGLADALFAIPGISDTISDAFNTILNTGVEAIAGFLNDITQSLEQNP